MKQIKIFLLKGIATVFVSLFLMLSANAQYDWSAHSAGDGTAADPYQISTPEHLNGIRDNWGTPDMCYILTQDIDMAGFGNFAPIKNKQSNYFDGHINGNGFSILNLSISSTENKTGLLYSLREGGIKNLGLVNVNITSKEALTGGFIGLIPGNSKSPYLTNCHVSGTIEGKVKVGGLVGDVLIATTMENCLVSATVTCTDTKAGGLIGNGPLCIPHNCVFVGKATNDPINGNTGAPATSTNLFFKSYPGIKKSNKTIAPQAVAVAEADLADETKYDGLGLGSMWEMGATEGYPILAYMAPGGTIEVVVSMQDKLAMSIGDDAYALTATVYNATDDSVTWKITDVSPEGSITMDAGVITAVAVGTATITATSVENNTKSASCAVSVTAPIGVKETNEVAYSIFPNPSSDIITIKGENIDNVSLFNSKGNIVLSTTETTISVGQLPAGVYCIKIKSANLSSTRIVIIK